MNQVRENNLQTRGYYDHERMKAKQKEAGLTDLELAVRAGVSPTSVVNTMRGKTRTFRIVAEINGVINTVVKSKYEDLFADVEPPVSDSHRAIRANRNPADSAVKDRSVVAVGGSRAARSKTSVKQR